MGSKTIEATEPDESSTDRDLGDDIYGPGDGLDNFEDGKLRFDIQLEGIDRNRMSFALRRYGDADRSNCTH